jgi:hypothetical protein
MRPGVSARRDRWSLAIVRGPSVVCVSDRIETVGAPEQLLQ